MSDLNELRLIGHLGNDPKLTEVAENKTVCRFRLATNEVIRLNNGDTKTHTEWHEIETWNRLATQCHKYLKRGRQVAVTGKLRTHTYTDNDGVKHTVIRCLAHDVQFLGSAPKKETVNQ